MSSGSPIAAQALTQHGSRATQLRCVVDADSLASYPGLFLATAFTVSYCGNHPALVHHGFVTSFRRDFTFLGNDLPLGRRLLPVPEVMLPLAPAFLGLKARKNTVCRPGKPVQALGVRASRARKALWPPAQVRSAE